MRIWRKEDDNFTDKLCIPFDVTIYDNVLIEWTNIAIVNRNVQHQMATCMQSNEMSALSASTETRGNDG